MTLRAESLVETLDLVDLVVDLLRSVSSQVHCAEM